MTASCIIPNCGKRAPAVEPFCAEHGFPRAQRKDGKEPCGECRLPVGERCDICGAIALPTVSEATKPVTPAGWTITAGRWPEPDWLATHADFDASYEGPEDGWVGNGLSCYADTRDELLAEIAEIEAEHPHFIRKRHDPRNHAANCDFQTDQYLWECTCGVRAGEAA